MYITTPRLVQTKSLNRLSIKVKPMLKRWRYSHKLKRQMAINHVRSDFAVSTTHGLPYIVNQNLNWCERVFWAATFCGSLVLVFYLVAVQLARFIETPIVKSVEMDYFNWNVSYPAFTLCPLIKQDVEAFGTILNDTNVRTGKNLEKYLWSIVSANLLDLETLDVDLPSDVVSLIDPKDYTRIAATTFKKFDPASITTNTNWPITVEEVMTELGMCHTVNSNIASFDNPSKWKNSSVGVVSYKKSNIELSIHDRDFFTQIMSYADIYTVYIHSPDETILTTTSSYTHSLKGFMSFGVQVWISKMSEELRAASIRLRKCRLINEPISNRFPIYSYNRCMLECRIKMIRKICGCIPHFYKPLPNERICRIDELKCIIKYKKEILTLSAPERMLNKNKLPKNSRECGCESLCDNEIYQKDYENFIPQSEFNRLRIGISSFPKVRVVREIIFSGYEILLKIGGAVNLCIGSSIISMVEFGVTFMKIPIYCLVQKIKSIKWY